MTPRPLLASALVLAAAACGDGSRSTPPTAAPSGVAGAASSTPVPSAGTPGAANTTPVGAGGLAGAEEELSTQPMELLRFRFTSGIDKREPKDELREVRPGQRVYAFLAIRNRTGNKRGITLAWSVGGAARTTLDLEVEESWQYRTWGYNTVAPTDRGTLRLEVTDDAGNSVVEREIPIRP